MDLKNRCVHIYSADEAEDVFSFYKMHYGYSHHTVHAANCMEYPYLRISLHNENDIAGSMSPPSNYEIIEYDDWRVLVKACACAYDEDDNKKEENNNMNMFGNIEFGMNKDKNIASTLMGVAVKSEGGWMVYDKDKKAITNLGDFKSGDFPVYLIPTKTPAVGEMVKYNGRYMYITEIPKEGGVKAIAADTGRVEEIVPVKNILGMNIFTKVVSVADGIMNEKADMKKIMLLSVCAGEGKPEMNQMLPLMMLADKDDEAEGDDKKLMKMAMLMSACSGGDQNQMLPLLMMDML